MLEVSVPEFDEVVADLDDGGNKQGLQTVKTILYMNAPQFHSPEEVRIVLEGITRNGYHNDGFGDFVRNLGTNQLVDLMPKLVDRFCRPMNESI